MTKIKNLQARHIQVLKSLLIDVSKSIHNYSWISTRLYLFAFCPLNRHKAKELICSSFLTCSPFSVLNVSGPYFLSLSLLQAIPLPVAGKEDPSALGQYHKCAQTNPLPGDHSEWARPEWHLPRLPGDSHPQSEDHCPRPGWRPQEHSGSQVRICFHLTSKVFLKNKKN